jgi:hypothetical protein
MITMKRFRRPAVALAWAFLIGSALASEGDRGSDDRGAEKFKASLSRYQEVPTLSSAGTANFRARIADDGQSFDWVLTTQAWRTSRKRTFTSGPERSTGRS